MSTESHRSVKIKAVNVTDHDIPVITWIMLIISREAILSVIRKLPIIRVMLGYIDNRVFKANSVYHLSTSICIRQPILMFKLAFTKV